MKTPRWLPALCAIAAAGMLAATVALLVQDARMMRGRSGAAGLPPRPANLAGINVALLGVEPAAQQAALQAIAGIGLGWVVAITLATLVSTFRRARGWRWARRRPWRRLNKRHGWAA